ncbi:unnamed protein product [Peronospora belbahrii]|uniref:Uncharacterized protein n=1 Tax=Peronospora belbahrii TaxID=622444 RepID=A0AAU9L5S3_9STRA|nr:unnamed protein product [Peronospora belbahrii]CAH0521710.1 unnamed protein product [Peronospora belbahrii]
MDLSMILSPAFEEEEHAAMSPTLRMINHKWRSDELQCAVAILQDFRQLRGESYKNAQHDIRGNGGVQYVTTHKHEEGDNIHAQSIACPDNTVQVVAAREDGMEIENARGQRQQFHTDSVSKLDLLVQADAIIKHHLPKTLSSHKDDASQHLRSGVWSCAEEKYAAALVAYFLEGLLDLPEGSTLRKFVAEKLRCNRRRVSMKLSTGSLAGQKIQRKIGASIFVAANPPPSDQQRQEINQELERLWRASLNSELWNNVYNEDGGEGHAPSQPRLLAVQEESKGDGNCRCLNKFTQRNHKKKLEFVPKRGIPRIIRTGFESPEEEEFVTTMFEFFMDGSLDLPEGTTLVRYLCQQLGCTPMQLSMKLAPRRVGEHKFPNNVGHIRYVRKATGDALPGSSNDNHFSEEVFEMESRITELRLAREEAHKSAHCPIASHIKRERKSSTAGGSSKGTANVASTTSDSFVCFFQRSGPWSHDEEVYAAALIDCFLKGVLEIAEGTTLRAFLSSRLCCNPMRISKKLASECIAEIRIPKKLRSSTYVRNVEVTPEEQSEAEGVLNDLQRVYMCSSTAKQNNILGLKRSRRSQDPRPRPFATTIATDSDATGSDPDACKRSPIKRQKRAKFHTLAQEKRKQRCQMPHTSLARTCCTGNTKAIIGLGV